MKSLPQGYDAVLDDEESNVSAGEKQLLTIARAFLARPSVLILDEATSSVDTRTEVLLQKAMSALRSDRTSFVIAHRLSTIRDADLTLVMEAGPIVEQGTHASLMEAGGAYAAQFAAPGRSLRKRDPPNRIKIQAKLPAERGLTREFCDSGQGKHSDHFFMSDNWRINWVLRYSAPSILSSYTMWRYRFRSNGMSSVLWVSRMTFFPRVWAMPSS